MSFLSGQHSFSTSDQYQFPSKNTGKPLPQLPADLNTPSSTRKQKLRQPTRNSFNTGPPVEYSLPSDAAHSSSGHSTSDLIRRVSSIFKSTPKRKTSLFSAQPPLQSTPETPYGALSHKDAAPPPPSAFAPYSTAYDSSEESYNDSLDDIRRPSGLGSAASFSSHRSLPLSPPPLLPTVPLPPKEPEEDVSVTVTLVRSRSRTRSTPNLLRSLSLKAKNKLRSRRGSVSQSPATSAPPPAIPSPQEHARPGFQLPVEVVDLVLANLAPAEIAALARLSRAFCLAARLRFYRRLDLQELSPKQVEKVVALLASRRDLAELVQHFSCTNWPLFFNDGRQSASVPKEAPSPDSESQLRNTLLTATFTLALQRMSNLAHLTLPSFDLSLLSQHSAFGLKSMTFLNSTMSMDEMTSMLNWLDGQINIAVLSFPNLKDKRSTANDFSRRSDDMSASTPLASKPDTPVYYLNTPVTIPNSQTIFTQSNPYLKVSPHTTPSSSPMSPSFTLNVPQAAISSTSLVPPSTTFDSSTLLPMINMLHATPALLVHLVPRTSPSNAFSTSRSLTDPDPSIYAQATSALGRPVLRHVCLNISTNLYDGLRPSAVMACLKGIEHLSLQFSDGVDRRTLEKVLTAVSSVLGSGVDTGENNGNEATLKADGVWQGLESLEITFKVASPLSHATEETVYRTLQSTLPRYAYLHHLHLSFPPGQRLAKPRPPSPLDVGIANAHNKPVAQTIIIMSEPEPANGTSTSASSYQESISSEIQDDNMSDITDHSPTTDAHGKPLKVPDFPLPPSTSPSVLLYPASQHPRPPTPSGALPTLSNGLEFRSPRSSFVPLQDQSHVPVCAVTQTSAAASPSIKESTSALQKDGLTTEEHIKIEAWARQCPSLRTISLSGMTWNNPLSSPAPKADNVSRVFNI